MARGITQRTTADVLKGNGTLLIAGWLLIALYLTSTWIEHCNPDPRPFKQRSHANVPKTVDAQRHRSASVLLTMVSLCHFHRATATSQSRSATGSRPPFLGAPRRVTGRMVSQRLLPPLLQQLHHAPVVVCATEWGDSEPSISNDSWHVVPTSSSFGPSGASAATLDLRTVSWGTTDINYLRITNTQNPPSDRVADR